MTNALTGRPSRARTVCVAWLALSALAIAVFAPLRYLLNSVPDLAATGEEALDRGAGGCVPLRGERSNSRDVTRPVFRSTDQ